jgi:hypothetical protein
VLVKLIFILFRIKLDQGVEQGQHRKDENEDARFVINFVEFRVEGVEEEHEEKTHQDVKGGSGCDQHAGSDPIVNMEPIEDRRHDEDDFDDD